MVQSQLSVTIDIHVKKIKGRKKEIEKERKLTWRWETQVSEGLSASRTMGIRKVVQNCSW